MLTTA